MPGYETGLTIGILATGVVGAVGAVGARALFSPRSKLFGSVVYRGPKDAPPRLALTFDDGPDPETTPLILDILDELKVSATFFVIGLHAERHPAFLERIHCTGHEIGNHSYSHAHFGTLRRYRYWVEEISRTQQIVVDATGQYPRLFRPPMGFKNRHLAKAVRDQQLTTVTWTRRAFDGVNTTSSKIVKRLGTRAAAGDIIALHDGIDPNGSRNAEATIEALPRLIEHFRYRGLKIVPLQKLIGRSPIQDSNGD